jgi:glycerate dehydrogenase
MNDKTVVLNAARMNYDGKLDFSVLSSQVTVYDTTEPSQLLERIQGFDIIVTKEMPVSGDLIRQFPDSVRLICEAGTGYNNIDLDACREKGIMVCNIPAYSTQRVAHTAIMLLLNLSSAMQKQLAMLAKGNHDNFTKCLQVDHTEVNGKTLGVIGAGNIGREVIRVAKALDMSILVYTRTPRADEDGIRYVSLEEVLKNSDYLTLHCPLTPETRHLIRKETLALMKPTAFLINTSRGALVDEAALIEALQNGVIAGAALDVQETEPPAEDNPLYTMENVILTPHMGWKGLETRQRLVSILAGNIQAYLSGSPINVVCPKA